MRKKKLKFMVLEDCNDSPKSIAVRWNKLPSDLLEEIDGSCIHNVTAVDSEGNIAEKSVVYLKPVTRLKKDIDTYTIEDKNIVIGYDLF